MQMKSSSKQHSRLFQDFYQLFTIFIHFRGHTLPALHILMNQKTEKLYEAVTIRRLIPEFNSAFAIGDFEKAPRNALVSVIPSITIIGCWFHFTKAIFAKIKKLGLSKLYKQNQIFTLWIRKIMALNFASRRGLLPVYLYMEIQSTGLNDTEKELVNNFIKYCSKTWLIGKFDLSVFIYENATNNGAESYHKSLNSLIKPAHPNLTGVRKYVNISEPTYTTYQQLEYTLSL